MRKNTENTIIEPEFLLKAYSAGFFPMADSHTGDISWYSPEWRGIIPLHSLKISRSLRQTLRRKIYEVHINRSFESVIQACANRPETWISDVIIASYLQLHRLGYAHSVECWQDDRLVGGLYGVALKSAFFGESMFSLKRDASKVALVFLVRRLLERGYQLLDTQYLTPHLQSLGACEISRNDYLKLLHQAMQRNCSFI